jgi:hypothetical protein
MSGQQDAPATLTRARIKVPTEQGAGWVKGPVRTSMEKRLFIGMISGFHCGVNEVCALLGCYAASSGNFLPTFRNNLSVPSAKVRQSKKSAGNNSGTAVGKEARGTWATLEDGTDRLSRNVCSKLPF